jgi:hypothetical protein
MCYKANSRLLVLKEEYDSFIINHRGEYTTIDWYEGCTIGQA